MRRVHSDSKILLLLRSQDYLLELEKTQKNCLVQSKLIQDQKESIERIKKEKLLLIFKIFVEKYLFIKKIKKLEKINNKLNNQISVFKNNLDQINHNDFLNLEENFICSITLEPFEDPVVAADGNTYEKDALKEWFKKNYLNENIISPLNGNYFEDKKLVPNINLKSLMTNMRENFNNLKVLNQHLIIQETSKTILDNEIQDQKILIEYLDTEREKKFKNKGLFYYIICCLPNKIKINVC